jgi:hypothetical protein
LIRTRVDGFLSSPQCVDVGMIGGRWAIKRFAAPAFTVTW